MNWLYLLSVVVSAGCMATVDHRWKLCMFDERYGVGRTLVGIGGIFVLLFAADCVGIRWDVFHKGDSPYMSHVQLFPHMPLEEIFFLLFLGYFTLIIVSAADRLLGREGSDA
ncbi:lycopene cyclase domain-containing protein [Corynebacterium heidelbergense]|uniref:Lycopene cyclase domain-containing protein n=1 Tax=Corynebacterium heidelbergense TaxID=2055947 RepID=A0A364VAQ3_9CORY|nr:lycopene cyclase domain-containing protein [Corynebacterium heidelbergense]RAV33707.1 lycopene cyclase domain-containing protein [Corynebacterium heidelbergense]WCZ35747.1 hypothetical protein CHEID_00840 [Corynebacterium heidelbergense]